MLNQIKRKLTRQQKTRIRSIGKHPFAIPVTILLLSFFLGTAIVIDANGQTIGPNDSRAVKLYVDGREMVVPTRARTVGNLLERLSIPVRDKDIVEPALDTAITEAGFQVNVYRSRIVLVEDKGKKIVLETAEPTPERVAKMAGLKIYPEDDVQKLPVDIKEPVDAIQEGTIINERVVVDRATPVHFNLYGKSFAIRTRAQTVGQLLEERSVRTLPDDTIQPAPETAITEDLQIFIVRKGKQVISQEELIESPVERREDAGLNLGITIVLEEGAQGKRVVTYEIELENGKEVTRREIQSVVIEPPVKKVIKVGTKRNTFSGGFEAALAALRSCESGGNYSINTGNGYYGAYQYNYSTWNKYAGYEYPHQAPKIVQDQKAWETYQGRGWQPWPGCTVKLGLQDVYR